MFGFVGGLKDETRIGSGVGGFILIYQLEITDKSTV